MFRCRPTLYVFVGAYLPVLSAWAYLQGNQEFLFYAVAMVVMIVAVMALDRRVHFTLTVLWLLAVWGLIHMLGGTVPVGTDEAGKRIVLYAWRPIEDLPKYDQVVHTFGFFAATLAGAECVKAAVSPDRPLRIGAGLAVAFALMGMGLGALNEVLEFAATRLFEETGVGGYVNTGWDLVSNMLGASLAAILLLARPPKNGQGGPKPAPSSDS